MSLTARLPNHLRPRREKVFGAATGQPLDREAKVRIMFKARALLRATEVGKHYGPLTAKAVAVLEALLWGFHNAKNGQCMPSYETIAERAGCARSTVALALKALEAEGLLSWVNRITRVIEPELDLFGRWVKRWRTIRISNAYSFRDPGAKEMQIRASKSEIRSGTSIQESYSSPSKPPPPPFPADSPIKEALERLGRTLGATMPAPA